MLPEGLRRQRKARSPASLRQGASQTFFQQIYAFTKWSCRESFSESVILGCKGHVLAFDNVSGVVRV
jgi:hypothetical protein